MHYPTEKCQQQHITQEKQQASGCMHLSTNSTKFYTWLVSCREVQGRSGRKQTSDVGLMNSSAAQCSRACILYTHTHAVIVLTTRVHFNKLLDLSEWCQSLLVKNSGTHVCQACSMVVPGYAYVCMILLICYRSQRASHLK